MEASNVKAMREALEETQSIIKKCLEILNRIPDSCGYGGLIEDVADELCYLRYEHVDPALAAPVDSRDVLESPRDSNGKHIHVGDAVHMLKSGCDGDREWDDVVFSLEYVGEGEGGDDWLVYGEDGAAWACECEVLGRRGDGDGQ